MAQAWRLRSAGWITLLAAGVLTLSYVAGAAWVERSVRWRGTLIAATLLSAFPVWIPILLPAVERQMITTANASFMVILAGIALDRTGQRRGWVLFLIAVLVAGLEYVAVLT